MRVISDRKSRKQNIYLTSMSAAEPAGRETTMLKSWYIREMNENEICLVASGGGGCGILDVEWMKAKDWHLSHITFWHFWICVLPLQATPSPPPPKLSSLNIPSITAMIDLGIFFAYGCMNIFLMYGMPFY